MKSKAQTSSGISADTLKTNSHKFTYTKYLEYYMYHRAVNIYFLCDFFKMQSFSSASRALEEIWKLISKSIESVEVLFENAHKSGSLFQADDNSPLQWNKNIFHGLF